MKTGSEMEAQKVSTSNQKWWHLDLDLLVTKPELFVLERQ